MKGFSFLVCMILLGLVITPVFSAPSLATNSADDGEHAVSVLEADQQHVLLSLETFDYRIEKVMYGGEEFDRIDLEGATIGQNGTTYQLPVIHALVGVPPQANISLSISDDQVEVLIGTYRLAPAEVPIVLQDELQPGTYTVPSDSNVKDGVYPSLPVEIVDDAWLRDQRIIKLAFYPFQYDNQSGNLALHRFIQVRVDFGDGGAWQADSALQNSRSNPYDALLEKHILNYEQAKSWRAYPYQISRREGITNAIPEPPVQAGETGYKIRIQEDGIYRLSYEALLAAGVPVEGLDLSTNHFHLSNQGREVAIFLQHVDNTFSEGDYLLFYGQEFDGQYLADTYYADEDENWRPFSGSQDIYGTYITWYPEFNAEMVEKYTDENVYWLTINNESMISMQGKANEPDIAPIPEVYTSTVRAEESNFWHTLHFTGEDTWFWDQINVGAQETRTYLTSLSAIAVGEYTATLRGEIVARTNDNSNSPDHNVILSINDPNLANPVLDFSWDGKSRYKFEVQFPQSRLLQGENQLNLVANKVASVSEQLYFDWYEIEYQREYKTIDNQIWFTGSQSGQWNYLVDGFGGVSANDLWVYDVTDPLNPVYVWNVPFDGSQVDLTVTHLAESKFHIGNVQDISSTNIVAYHEADFDTPAEYLIISHVDLIDSAQSLADYRTAGGIDAQVYDFEDVINTFNFGIYHPIAIKNFLTYTFDTWQVPPYYVLLVGDGHWNFRSYPAYASPPIYMPPNLSWVDPWQGEVDSANLLATVVGDDIWPDLMIARLPVNSVSELNTVIQKIQSYETTPLQAWGRNFTYVADDTPDTAGDFVASAEGIIEDFISPGNIPDRIYLDDYMDTGTCGDPYDSRACPAATQALIAEINQNSGLFMNYYGHASIDFWAHEKLFTNEDIDSLTNANKLPIFLSSTCLDGYWIYTNKFGVTEDRQSLIEELLRASGRGAVGAFAATGLGVSTGHEYLQHGFYESVFVDGIDRLGPASMAAKLNLYQAGVYQDLLHTFTVFGDPALQFEIQQMDLVYLPLLGRE